MGTSVPFMFIGSCVLASFEKVLNNVAEDFDGDIWRFLRVNHSDPDIVVRRCCHLGNWLRLYYTLWYSLSHLSGFGFCSPEFHILHPASKT